MQYHMSFVYNHDVSITEGSNIHNYVISYISASKLTPPQFRSTAKKTVNCSHFPVLAHLVGRIHIYRGHFLFLVTGIQRLARWIYSTNFLAAAKSLGKERAGIQAFSS